jgi:hypothetical protein
LLALRDIDVLVSEIDAAALWGWAIDLARPGNPSVAYSLDIAGWVLGRDAPAVAVELVYDGVVFQQVPSLDVRPDVAAAYPAVAGAEYSGFRANASVPGITTEVVVGAQAVLRDHRRVPLARIRARRGWQDEVEATVARRGPTASPPGTRC